MILFYYGIFLADNLEWDLFQFHYDLILFIIILNEYEEPIGISISL